MKIYAQLSLQASEKQLLIANTQGHEVIFRDELPNTDEQQTQLLAAHIVFGNAPVELLNQSSTLRWLQLYSAGIDPYQELTFEANPSLIVTNLRGFFGRPVAETALAGIMAMYRGIDTLARLQTQQHWVGSALRPQLRTLRGAKVVVLGAGSIGLTFKKLLQGFDCEVLVMSRSAGDIHSLDALDAVLPTTDILLNTLPETPETIGILDKKRLSLLSANSLFANVGRGSAVEESALIELLTENRIYGAVLDVTEEEPLPPNHPLWSLPNVLLTQHTAGGFGDENRNKVLFFIENLRRFEQGEPLDSIVDFARGY